MEKQKSGESNIQRDDKSTKIIRIKPKFTVHGVRFLRFIPKDVRGHGAGKDEEGAAIARDGRHLRLGKQASGPEAWRQAILQPRGEGGAGVPEDVHPAEREGLHRPRTKFLDVEKANLSYRKQRKHSNAQTRKMTRRLLNLLGKILKEIRRMGREREGQELLTVKENGIQTSFVKRGRPSQGKKNQDYVRQELARVRATAMEGSFGTRRSITRCDGSRRGRRRRRSCTSSSASTPPTRYAWRSGSWNDRKRKRPSWAAKKVPKRSSTTGIPGCPCEKRRLSTKSGGFEQFWQQKTEQTQPLVATS